MVKTTSTIVHIIHNYENIVRAMAAEMIKIENTMEQIYQAKLDIPDEIARYYSLLSDARASLYESYNCLIRIKEIT